MFEKIGLTLPIQKSSILEGILGAVMFLTAERLGVVLPAQLC